MRALKRKATDKTVDERKGIIHEAISEAMEVRREPFEIMADSKLMDRPYQEVEMRSQTHESFSTE